MFCLYFRDHFYELIRIWQEHHMTPGWSLIDQEGRRIFELVTQRTKLANHIHFARLFQSQLIQMCKGDNSVKVEGDDQHITLLVQLKRSNPDKFKRLVKCHLLFLVNSFIKFQFESLLPL